MIYTYHTAKKIVSKYKDIEFYFLIGADQLNNLKVDMRYEEVINIEGDKLPVGIMDKIVRKL